MTGRVQTHAYERGQAMIVAVVLFLAGTLILLGGIAIPVLAEIRMVNDLVQSKQSLFTAEAALEDAVYRLKEGMNFTAPKVLVIGNSVATTTTQAILDQTEVVSVGDRNDRIRTMRVLLTEGAGAAFNYGLQADTGGIHLKNTSSIRGNVFSNGPVTGENSNIVRGDVISANGSGLIDGIHATGTAYAHTIQDSDIDGDAYYQVISGTTVRGTSYSNSPDQATSTLPIPDSMVENWKSNAEAGGVISSPCPYKIEGTAAIGPVKITCNLEISGTGYTLTLNGMVWVTGNIIIKNDPKIQVNSSLGSKSIALIADNPSNHLSSSKIDADNSATFSGSGSAGSYVLLLSQNESAEQGGGETAILVANTASGDLLIYAGHGKIDIKNSVKLKEVTGYRIEAQNSAEVIYELGLANLLFTSGPSGGFVIDDWREIE